jgi:hypothetical protein
MDAQTDRELETFGVLESLMQVSHGSEDTQTRPYCSMRIILMGVGIAKIHQETIP